MSAFLGPIHFWLYNKIKIQNSLAEEIFTFAESKDINNLKAEADRQFGFIDVKPLEELIDTTNIHGWLQECVSTVEYRLAYVVTSLLKVDASYLEELKELYFNYGKQISAFDNNTTVDQIYKQLNDTFLDGMPCDHANAIVAQEVDSITWKRNVCVHQQYWAEVGGDIKNYYVLREEFLKGFLGNSGADFKKIDEVTYQISK